MANDKLRILIQSGILNRRTLFQCFSAVAAPKRFRTSRKGTAKSTALVLFVLELKILQAV
jgi:hypothetical protein